jgi:hypothetical protein
MKKKSAISKPARTKLPSNYVPKNLIQVIGWSVHCPDSGRLGPLFCDPQGLTFYLDTVTNLGFQLVQEKDNMFID